MFMLLQIIIIVIEKICLANVTSNIAYCVSCVLGDDEGCNISAMFANSVVSSLGFFFTCLVDYIQFIKCEKNLIISVPQLLFAQWQRLFPIAKSRHIYIKQYRIWHRITCK